MLQFFKTLDKQKGTSIIELMVMVATASIVIGGLSFKAGDVFDMAKDTQRIANLRQMAIALELYYSDHQTYPRVTGLSSGERWPELISKLTTGSYLASFPPEKENYDYQELNNGENYVIRVLLKNIDDSAASYLRTDWDGMIGRLNCDGPYYCIKM